MWRTKTLFRKRPFLLADIGEGITECEIIQWFVKSGQKVQQFDKLCEVQSDKASVEITSRYDGIVETLNYQVGEMAKVGEALLVIEDGEADLVDKTQAAPSVSVLPTITSSKASIPEPSNSSQEHIKNLATPATRGLAKKHSIDIAKINGTGKDGRVSKADILKYIQGGPVQAITKTAIDSANELKSLSAIQKSMLKQMTKSLAIPHFGYCDEIEMDSCVRFRSDINAILKDKGIKISYMPILIKALSVALLDFPILNAKLINADDLSKAALEYRSSHNIGIAMDTPAGLVVPNIKHVQQKSILQIATELSKLVEFGKINSIPPADFQGGTISLSNIGVVGGTYLSPVVVTSEVCIGAVGKIQRLPRFEIVEGKEKVSGKHIMTASWSADHRVIDGATLARFVSKWKQLLENPVLLSATLK